MTKPLGFERVSKAYGAQAVLVDFTLNLPTGQASCLMGPSGAGKTTLLRLLMGLERPDAGRVFTFFPQSAVFQEDRLLPHLGAPGNLRLVTGRGHERAIRETLQSLGLHEAADKPVADYSGGMKRRVAIARALLSPFELLLLDEPFKGLDEDTKVLVARVILGKTQGKTVLLVSHDAQEAALLSARVFTL